MTPQYEPIKKQGRPEHYYPREGNTRIIALRLQNIKQLFYSLDASPFLEHDLDDKAEAYILRSMTELKAEKHVKLVFYVNEDQLEEARETIPATLQNYFEYSEDMAGFQVKRHFAQARVALLIGLIFLTCCVSASIWFGGSSALPESGTLGSGSLVNSISGLHLTILQESLLIIGWVAMWRPLEMFLYLWWPDYELKLLCRKIGKCPVEIRVWQD